MIPVDMVAEPQGFADARLSGLNWLATHPNDPEKPVRPPPHWSPFLRPLREGFFRRCGYTAIYEPVGTVDHFNSVSGDRTKAYDWSNYRFCSGWINSAKKPSGDGKWVDPYRVPAGCFEVQLPDMQLRPGSNVPPDLADAVAYTLAHLPIRDDERIIELRREWYEYFKDQGLPFALLERMAPQVADAVRRFNLSRGRPEDCKLNLP